MAETYKAMDKAAADGMRTGDDKVAAVADGWARVAKPLSQFKSPWPNQLNSSSALLRWQSLAHCATLPVHVGLLRSSGL